MIEQGRLYQPIFKTNTTRIWVCISVLNFEQSTKIAEVGGKNEMGRTCNDNDAERLV